MSATVYLERIGLGQHTMKFKIGDVVWVKFSSFWWPAEIQDPSECPEALLAKRRKNVAAVAKFFSEDK